MKKYLILLTALVASVSHGYRDLETGTFLTRDPIGYGDGPNVYCYVNCNPIIKFDPVGLDAMIISGGVNEDISTDTEHDLNPDNYVDAAAEEIEKLRADGYTDTMTWAINIDSLKAREDSKGIFPYKLGQRDGKTVLVKERSDLKSTMARINAIAKKHNVDVISFSSRSEFVKVHNEAKGGKKRDDSAKIDTWRYFGHGTSSSLLTAPSGTENINRDDMRQINPASFSVDADMKSYACNSAQFNKSGNVSQTLAEHLYQNVTGVDGRVNYAPVASGGNPVPGTKNRGGASVWKTAPPIAPLSRAGMSYTEPIR